MRSKILSIILSLAMVLTMIPIMSSEVYAATHTVTFHHGEGISTTQYLSGGKKYGDGGTVAVETGTQVTMYYDFTSSNYMLDDVYTDPECTVRNGGSVCRYFIMPDSDVDVYVSAKIDTNLKGTVSIQGDGVVGNELTAVLTGGNSSNLEYKWENAGGTVVSTTNKYTPTSADVGKNVKVTVSSPDKTGTLSTTKTIVGASHTINFVITGEGNVKYSNLPTIYTSDFSKTAAYGENVQFWLDNGVTTNITTSDSDVTVKPNGSRGQMFKMPDKDITIYIQFVVEETDLAHATVTLDSSECTYNGAVVDPGIKVVMNDKTLLKNADYAIKYTQGDGINVGIQKFVVAEVNHSVFTGESSEYTYEIKPYEEHLSAAISTSAYVFNGTEIKPAVTTANALGKAMTEGVDYDLQYDADCVTAGEHNIKVTFKGNYKGEENLKYDILPISDATATLTKTDYDYTGTQILPEVQASNSLGIPMVEGRDYVVECITDGIELGEQTAKVTFKGNYYGTALVKYNIVQVPAPEAVAKLTTTKYTYTGKSIKPQVLVTCPGYTLTEDVDYTVTYPVSSKNVGTYKIRIDYYGSFTGNEVLTFAVYPKGASVKSITPGTKKMTVKMTTKPSSKGASTYQIYYKQKGTSTWKKTTTTASYKTIKSLKKGKCYYVKARAYKKVGTKTYYGAWSKTKLSKKIK